MAIGSGAEKPDWYKEWEEAPKSSAPTNKLKARFQESTRAIGSFGIAIDKIGAFMSGINILPSIYNDVRCIISGRQRKTAAVRLFGTVLVGAIGAAIGAGITAATLGIGAPAAIPIMLAGFGFATPLGHRAGKEVGKRIWPEEQLALTPKHLDKLKKLNIDENLADLMNDYFIDLIKNAETKTLRQAYETIRIHALENGDAVAINYAAKCLISELSTLKKIDNPSSKNEADIVKVNEILNKLKDVTIRPPVGKEYELLEPDIIEEIENPGTIAAKKAAKSQADAQEKAEKEERKIQRITTAIQRASQPQTTVLQSAQPSQTVSQTVTSPPSQTMSVTVTQPSPQAKNRAPAYTVIHKRSPSPEISTKKTVLLTEAVTIPTTRTTDSQKPVSHQAIETIKEKIDGKLEDYKIQECVLNDKTGGLELTLTGDQPQKVYVDPLDNQDGITFSVETASIDDISLDTINNICKLAVESAEENAEFDLSDCPQEILEDTKEALEAAIGAAIAEGKFTAENAPKVKPIKPSLTMS